MIQGDSGVIELALDNYILKTGDKVYFTVKKSYDSEVILQKIVEEFEANGVAKIRLEPKDTKELELNTYLYDIQLSLADGTVDTVVLNKIQIVGGITND